MERGVINKEMSSQNNIYPKPCVYNCNTQIYWNVAKNVLGSFHKETCLS